MHALDGQEKDGEIIAGDEKTNDTAARMSQPLNVSCRLRRFTGMSNLKRTALNVIANQLTEADIGASD